MNRIVARSLLGALAILISLLSTQRLALARPPASPAVFALHLSDFPAGSQLLRAGIESNQRLLTDHIFPGTISFWGAGRLTGYYMKTVQRAGASQTTLSYLVSIFGTTQQAYLAYLARYSSWFATFYFTNPPPLPVRLGDKGAQALFSMQLSPRQVLSELFFQRGAVLVEVFQEVNGGSPNAGQRHALLSIGRKLSAIARQHRSGV